MERGFVPGPGRLKPLLRASVAPALAQYARTGHPLFGDVGGIRSPGHPPVLEVPGVGFAGGVGEGIAVRVIRDLGRLHSGLLFRESSSLMAR